MQNNKEFIYQVKQAIDFYNNKEFLKAEFLYIQLLRNKDFVFPELYIGYANTLIELKKYEEAIVNFEKSLSYNKTLYESYFGIAISYEKLNHINASIKYYKKTIQFQTNFIQAYNNLGNVYQKINQYKKAEKILLKALKINPKISEINDSLSVLYQDLNKYKKAIRYHKYAIQYNSNNCAAYFNYSLSLLMMGKLKKGFEYYEYRLKLVATLLNDLPKSKRWDGKEIKGKTLFIYTEQGFGDSIQFCRYLPIIKKVSKANIIFKCQKSLINLFKNDKNIDCLIENNELPHYDFFLPLLSSGYVLSNTIDYIPHQMPYLRCFKPTKLNLQNKNNFKIGLTWMGSPKNSNNDNRSIQLDQFKPLFKLKQCQFYSLQKDNISKKELEKYNIIDLSNNLNDFNDTANYIDSFDLVISVDTSVAHLSLSLNKTTWVLLSNVSDYRWNTISSKTSWYPKAKIYSQKKLSGDWSDTIEDIKKDLLKLI